VSAIVVLDASAAVRAVMDAAAQPALLDRLAAAALVLAPTLMRVEAANALWKYQRAGAIDASDARDRHAEACLLVHRFVDEQALFPEALQLASDLDHPVYDAIYAVTARRHAATLLSFDRRLHALCAGSRIDCDLLGAAGGSS
jgi:predicted nucleic acid-binding protein